MKFNLGFPFRVLLFPRPFRAIYVIAVVLVSLFVMAFIWFGLYAALSPLRTAIQGVMSQYNVNNSTYPSFELADTFMANLWTYLLMLFCFGLLFWVWIYSQRKGQVMYE